MPDGEVTTASAGTRYIALIRHGAYHQRAETPSALQPFPLTDDGVDQAQTCAQDIGVLLNRHALKLAPVVHCSHQLRAWQTAETIVETLRNIGLVEELALVETAALAERSVGAVANLSTQEIETLLHLDPRYAAAPAGWKSDSAYRLPFQGAESLIDAGERVAVHLQSVAEATAPGHLSLCVGHGASFRHAALHLGLLKSDEIPRLSMYHARPLLLCYSGGDRWSHFAGMWKHRQGKETHQD